MHYENLTGEHAPLGPYSVDYAKKNEVGRDVLILGDGIAGCRTAGRCRKKGIKVVLVDNGIVKTRGQRIPV
jgi:NADPH-dependent 2,4-dienoyl-CoA reductase/sulfur reductase-like enzyme